MLDKFLSYIKEENLFAENERILLAVSGGMDSMAMVTLFLQAKFQIGVAHVHHHMRGTESDEEAEFVLKYCVHNNIPFHIHHIDPALLTSGNMHDTARKIRYEWMKKTALEFKYDLISTAHHKDDEVETFILNLMRGSSIKGLSGIPIKRKNIIRPLLFSNRDEIKRYVVQNNISYREDSSNSSDKYMRNKVRHHILPEMYATDSRSKTGILLSIKNVRKSNLLLGYLANEYTKKFIAKEGNITILKLTHFPDDFIGKELLFHTVQKYGFNAEQCGDMINQKKTTGKKFISKQYEAMTDRENLLIRPSGFSTQKVFSALVSPPVHILFEDHDLSFELISYSESINFEPSTFYVNADHLTFPLVLRVWKPGDKFFPFGMKGKSKKIKDFLIDKKISGYVKESVLVLENEGEIIALPGYTISEKVRLQSFTKSVLKITYNKVTSA